MSVDVNSDITLLMPLVGSTQAALKALDKGTGSASFTRATTATFKGSNGLMQTAASGELREEWGDGKNLLSYSEAFDNAAWTAGDVYLASAAMTAPNGKTTAYKISEDGATAAHMLQRADVSLIAGVQYTLSQYFKKGAGRDWVYLRLFDGTSTKYAWFNITTGAVGTCDSGATAFMSAIGNGWYRCSVTWTAVSGGGPGAVFGIADADQGISYVGNTAYYVYAWGAQLEKASSATRYVKAGSQALVPLGVLIEGQRTNLLTYSEQIDNAAWSNIDSGSISANCNTTPAGLQTADGMVEAAVTAYFGRYQSYSATSGTKYAYSCYVAAGTATWTYLREGVTGDIVFYNLSAGVVGTTSARFTNTRITNFGSGWWRIEAVWTADGTGTRRYDIGSASNDNVPSYLGAAGAVSVYFWGAQLEEGAFASSYIPTTSAAVTRNADVLTFPASGNISGPLGSVYAEFMVEMDAAGTAALVHQAIVGGNNMFMYVQAAVSTMRIFDGSTGATESSSSLVSYRNKGSTRWTGSAAGACLNGGAVGVGGFDGDMNAATNITIGGGYAGYGPAKLYLKNLCVLSRALSDAEMQAVTA